MPTSEPRAGAALHFGTDLKSFCILLSLHNERVHDGENGIEGNYCSAFIFAVLTLYCTYSIPVRFNYLEYVK
jgi:hypothetical protein